MSDLVNISAVAVDKTLPRDERSAEFSRQIGDPEHYECAGFSVTAVFPETAPPIETRLKELAK